jgi:histidine triad (HIT) family protein
LPFLLKTFIRNSANDFDNQEFGILKEVLPMGNCIFCQIVKREIPANTLYEDEHAMVFDDLNPQSRVHMLVIPKRHVVSLDDTKETDASLLGQLLVVCARVARDRDIAHSGYRVVANTGRGAGQSVFHLHFHVLGGRQFEWPPG